MQHTNNFNFCIQISLQPQVFNWKRRKKVTDWVRKTVDSIDRNNRESQKSDKMETNAIKGSIAGLSFKTGFS